VAETVPEYSLATFFLFDNGHDYIDESTNPSCSGWFAWRGIVAAVNRRVVGSTGVVRVRDAWICDFVEGLLGRPTVNPDIDEAGAAAEPPAASRRR